MDHGRHLEPHEIDLFLDDESGSQDATAADHVAACDECSRAVAEAREALAALEYLPHLTPRSGFADRVMSNVHVFEPLGVTIADRVESLVPSGQKARAVLLGLAAFSGLIMTALLVWLGSRLDDVVMVGNFALERLRMEAASGAQGFSVALLGESAAADLGAAGSGGLWVAAGVLAGSTAIATLGLRLAASAARRRRG